MDKNAVFEECLEILEEFDMVTVTLTDGEMYSIEGAENYVGGEEGYWMSSELGNVMYGSKEGIVCDFVNLFDCNEVEEISVD